MRKTLLLFLFLVLYTFGAHAEYRVFVLKIAKKSADPAADSSSDYRLVQSNLDPEQYRGYYNVAADEVVTYIDTWRCYGRTGGFADYCPNPKDNPKDQIPDTANSPP